MNAYISSIISHLNVEVVVSSLFGDTGEDFDLLFRGSPVGSYNFDGTTWSLEVLGKIITVEGDTLVVSQGVNGCYDHPLWDLGLGDIDAPCPIGFGAKPWPADPMAVIAAIKAIPGFDQDIDNSHEMAHHLTGIGFSPDEESILFVIEETWGCCLGMPDSVDYSSSHCWAHKWALDRLVIDKSWVTRMRELDA